MRYLSILIALLLGMLLAGILIYNGHVVSAVLDPYGIGYVRARQVELPLWQLIFGSVLFGVFLGMLLVWMNSTNGRSRGDGGGGGENGAGAGDRAQKDAETDYILGLTTKK